MTPEGLVASLSMQGVPVAQIVSQVKAAFNLSGAAMVALTEQTNLDPIQSAASIRTLYGATMAQLAGWFFDAGYDAAVVAVMLRSVFQATAEQIAGLLEDEGLTCVQTLMAVKAAVQGLTVEVAAAALKSAGYPADQVLQALIEVLSATASVAAGAVVAAGYAPAVAVQAVATAITSTQQLAQIVYENIDSGHAFLSQATQALKDHAQVTRETASQAMIAAARWAQQLIDSVLDQVFGPPPPPPSGSPADWNSWGQAAAAAARLAAGEWIAGATISPKRCRVDGPAATGGPGALQSSTKVTGRVRQALLEARAPDAVAEAWDAAFAGAWLKWADGTTIPGLGWYPSFALYPGPKAPPTPNIPGPMGGLVSRGAAAMTPRGLASTVNSKLGDAASEPGAAPAIQAFAVDLGGRFTSCMASCQLMKVMGSGPVPGFKPPYVSAAPVVGGTCSGGFIASHTF